MAIVGVKVYRRALRVQGLGFRIEGFGFGA